MSATLKVTQEAFTNPAGIMSGTFDVVVDGKSVGSIKWHEAIEVPVEPGHHTLQVRKGRYSSRVKAFDAAEDEFVAFRCNRRKAPADLGRDALRAQPGHLAHSRVISAGSREAQAVPRGLAGGGVRRDNAWTSAASGVVTPPAGLALALPAFCPKAGLHAETAGPASGRTAAAGQVYEAGRTRTSRKISERQEKHAQNPARNPKAN